MGTRWRRTVARAAGVVAACVGLAGQGGAQEPANSPAPSRSAPALVRLGKWGAAALFIGFTATGISRHDGADADYRALTSYCKTGGSCALAADGTYVDPHSESLYQQVTAGDRAARAWLITGQVALAGAAALFIVQLNYEHGTRNIPYEPEAYVAPGLGATLVGLRLPLGRR